MRKFYFLLFTFSICALSFGQTVFINELHYDNTGGDVDEGVEIAGPAGTDLTGYTLTPYNGSNGTSYTPIASLSGIIPNEGGTGYGAIWFPIAGLQNGAPDGIALDNGGSLIQFLSYEGAFAATNGVALGVTSTDIGVSESGSTPVGNSLQLTGSGTVYTNFSWATESASSPGLINIGQTFGTPTPTLSLSDGPTNGDTLVGDPETVNNANIDFNTTNFVMSNDAGGGVSDNSGDGYITWFVENTNGNVFVDGGNVFTSNDGNITYPISGLTNGETYYFEAELVGNAGASLSSPVVYSFTMTIATYNDVEDLATLRAQTVDPDTYYRVTGEVFHTYSRTSNNQKYFQDATGGILVHDPNFIISTVYNEGDGVLNLRGHLELFNGLLEFIPTDNDNWGVNSTGNTITPQVVTIADVESSLGVFESKLVRINNVTFADGNGVNTFSSSTNYNIDDGTATTPPSTFRTTFSEADYIGQIIPSGANDIIAIVGNFNGSEQFVSRSLSELTLSVPNKTIKKFAIYPNPTNTGSVNIVSASSSNFGNINVAVYDVLGKQVINKTMTSEKLNVSSLNTGVYIMKITQGKATSTKKLVIN